MNAHQKESLARATVVATEQLSHLSPAARILNGKCLEAIVQMIESTVDQMNCPSYEEIDSYATRVMEYTEEYCDSLSDDQIREAFTARMKKDMQHQFEHLVETCSMLALNGQSPLDHVHLMLDAYNGALANLNKNQ